MALRTVTPNHRNLQQISLDTSNIALCLDFDHIDSANIRDVIGKTIHAEWLKLDRLLAQLRESHSIRLEVL